MLGKFLFFFCYHGRLLIIWSIDSNLGSPTPKTRALIGQFISVKVILLGLSLVIVSVLSGQAGARFYSTHIQRMDYSITEL
jgi:hypothetical protein